MGFDPVTMAATISKLKANGQIGGEGKEKLLPTADGKKFTTYNGSLVGLEVEDYFKERRKAKATLERPDFAINDENGALCVFINAGVIQGGVFYNDAGGVIDKRCLLLTANVALLGSPLCLTKGYDTLLYAFEETNDTMGMGLTIPAGWYALNQNTFAMEPVDIEQSPILLFENFYETATFVDENCRAYIYENFPLYEKVSYTVKEENIVSYVASSTWVTWYPNFPKTLEGEAGALGGVYASLDYDKVNGNRLRCASANEVWSVTVYQPVIKPIDPKYLPGVCLPYVELSFEPDENGMADLSEADGTKLDEAYATGLPCVVNLGVLGANFIFVPAGGSLTSSFGSVIYNFSREGDGWKFFVAA